MDVFSSILVLIGIRFNVLVITCIGEPLSISSLKFILFSPKFKAEIEATLLQIMVFLYTLTYFLYYRVYNMPLNITVFGTLIPRGMSSYTWSSNYIPILYKFLFKPNCAKKVFQNTIIYVLLVRKPRQTQHFTLA